MGSTHEPLPPGTETRLAGFTDLAATAIANAQARVELREFAEEQAALRRVATLVARAAPPEEVFDAITREAGRLLRVDQAVLSRYDPDGQVTVVSHWARTSPGRQPATGLRLKHGGRNVNTIVFETARPARIDDYDHASGASAESARDWGYRSAVGVPISVESRLWGVMSLGSTQGPLPADTEARLAGFTELAATAIANAEAQAARTAARARVVAAADAARRRIERDLHDGAQQRLVSLGLQLRMAQAAPPGPGELVQWLGGVAAELAEVLEELREIARGLHPAILAQGGLRPALKALARRSAVPVELDVNVDGAAARAGRARRLLRGGRGADQHRQARARLRRRGPGGHQQRRPARARPRRWPRRRGLRGRLGPGRDQGPGRSARRPDLAAQPARRGHGHGHRPAPR